MLRKSGTNTAKQYRGQLRKRRDIINAINQYLASRDVTACLRNRALMSYNLYLTFIND